MTRFGIDQSDGVTAVSEYLRKKTIEVFRPQRAIQVIPNFIDTTRYAPRNGGGGCAKTQFAKKGEKILIHISNFRPSKRAEDAVRVLAAVRREVPSVLLMVGDGPERARTREIAVDLGVERHVKYLGQLDAPEEVLQCGDLFLLPSANESFGLAALEAMSTGMPVIGTTAEGLPELIRDGQTGYLVSVGDVPTMSRRAIEMLTDAKLHESMGKESRRVAVENYEASKIVPKYEEFYARVTGQTIPARGYLAPPEGLA
jgi:N-acetyl-alpha-D-glucosaminyl L-malate synthase BshA